jgi:hypothetical protein
MSWPELIFYGTIVIGIVGAPFVLLYWLYGFVRRVIAHARQRETGSVVLDFAALAFWLIVGVITVYVWGNAFGIDLPPVFDPLPGGRR